FPRFLRSVLDGRHGPAHTIHGEPCLDMDRIPTPSFVEYYQQYNHFLPHGAAGPTRDIWLPYESSRGCWWGEKHHCTFCGINGLGMKFREKSPDRVIAELRQLLATHPSNLITMYDNIMPHSYFKTLLPRLQRELGDLYIFYEQKANLSLG